MRDESRIYPAIDRGVVGRIDIKRIRYIYVMVSIDTKYI